VDTNGPMPGWVAGLRVGAGLATGSFALAISFGAFAVLHGWPAWLVILMSALTFSGSAQFTLVTGLAGGGGIVTALASASMINLRFVPMGAATAKDLHGRGWRRALEGQAVVDGSWVAAQRADGSIDRPTLFAATLVQWPAWTVGTAVGALAVPSVTLAHTIGVDVIFPGFFALLLFDALKARPALIPITATAVAIAAAACRILPAGPALLAGSAACLLALHRTQPETRREVVHA
jgi:predicted branched-subunit amino acid permease